MRKLLGAIYSVACNRRPFVPHPTTATGFASAALASPGTALGDAG
jgi:hypothetical protein